jgi:hypothetical protein
MEQSAIKNIQPIDTGNIGHNTQSKDSPHKKKQKQKTNKQQNNNT